MHPGWCCVSSHIHLALVEGEERPQGKGETELGPHMSFQDLEVPLSGHDAVGSWGRKIPSPHLLFSVPGLLAPCAPKLSLCQPPAAFLGLVGGSWEQARGRWSLLGGVCLTAWATAHGSGELFWHTDCTTQGCQRQPPGECLQKALTVGAVDSTKNKHLGWGQGEPPSTYLSGVSSVPHCVSLHSQAEHPEGGPPL